LDELLVLDPIVARIDLAYQVEPLRLLFGCDGTTGNFDVVHREFVRVSLRLRLALVLIGIKCVWLPLLDHLLGNFDGNSLGAFADL